MGGLPTILIVPGFWVGQAPYGEMAQMLIDAGFKVETLSHPSTGTRSPGNPSMMDDIASARQHVEMILDRGDDVVLFLHSAGGFLGSAGIKGLLKRDRGNQPGVLSAVLLTAATWPEGHDHQPPPCTYVSEGGLYCKTPEQLLYNDLPASKQAEWVDRLMSQPADNWGAIIPWAPWPDLPSTYIICEMDQVIPPAFQQVLAEKTGSTIVRIQAGHMATVSKPDEVAEIVKKAAQAAVA